MTMIPGVPRDCTHPRANHPHGHYLRARRDGCGCTPCLDAARRNDKRTRIRTETGTSSYTDPSSARAHVEQLLASGLTIGQLEARSGIHRTSIYALLGWFGHKPSRRITRKTETALLAITHRRVDDRDQGLVDGTGTVRRLQALMALGWPGMVLVERLGWSHRTLWTLTGQPPGPIRATTRDAVRELYDELSSTLPPPRAQVTYRRRLSRERGWAPPAAWDDDQIDDPAAVPSGHLPDTPVRLVELVEDLLDTDPTIRLHAAAQRLGRRDPAHLERQLYTAGRRDLVARLKRPDLPALARAS